MVKRFGRLAVAAALVIGVGACGAEVSTESSPSDGATSTAEAKPGELVISNWDKYMPENLIPDFEKATGIKVKLANHTTNEDIMGKLEAANGGGFDLVFVSGQFAESLAKRGWAAEIDRTKIPNLANLYPEAAQLDYDPGNTHSVPYTWGTTGICYRSDKVKTAPTSWKDLLEPAPELKGKVTMLATDRWLMLPALKQLGFSANSTDEGELEQARDLLLETKKHLLAYDDTTFYSKLVSGEAWLVEAWDGWCNYGIAENDKIKFVVPEEGSDLWADTMVVLESSKNKDAAMQFIDFVLKPESGKGVVDLLTYNTPNQAAMKLLDRMTIKQYPNLGMDPSALLEQEGLRDLGEAQPTWSRIVTEITS
jgi:spermidine/putrescine transport system substrate-binding protein